MKFRICHDIVVVCEYMREFAQIIQQINTTSFSHIFTQWSSNVKQTSYDDTCRHRKSSTIMDMSVNDTCSKRHTEKYLARELGHFAIDVLYAPNQFDKVVYYTCRWCFLYRHVHCRGGGGGEGIFKNKHIMTWGGGGVILLTKYSSYIIYLYWNILSVKLLLWLLYVDCCVVRHSHTCY